MLSYVIFPKNSTGKRYSLTMQIHIAVLLVNANKNNIGFLIVFYNSYNINYYVVGWVADSIEN